MEIRKPLGSQLERFFLWGEMDSEGRTIDFILNQDNEWWDNTHDFIQWIFPTATSSQFNPNAPIATVKEFDRIEFCRASSSQMLNILDRTYSFLDLSSLYPWWAKKENHNILRVSRILNCLSNFKRPVFKEIRKEWINALQEIWTHNPELDGVEEYWFGWQK